MFSRTVQIIGIVFVIVSIGYLGYSYVDHQDQLAEQQDRIGELEERTDKLQQENERLDTDIESQTIQDYTFDSKSYALQEEPNIWFSHCESFRDYSSDDSEENASTWQCYLEIEQQDSYQRVWVLRNNQQEYSGIPEYEEWWDSSDMSDGDFPLSWNRVDQNETVVIQTEHHYYVYDVVRNSEINSTYKSEPPRALGLELVDRKYKQFWGSNPYNA
ncbi:hypothetical protein HZS55_13015 [Halosimplex rubrum]|uniref:Uncharacterized protein n=1 Tax=Halosimplex rubrum TaxID=869889 RepID=A0A7D5T633_9EURY|nr:hypothetical protein [Halosimplex rubrum]QLH78169.1 hypothetical protein HZS55_13015 [Halosimplex rubrum]